MVQVVMKKTRRDGGNERTKNIMLFAIVGNVSKLTINQFDNVYSTEN